MLKEAHLIDSHRHRIYVGLLRRATSLGLKPFWIQQFRRTPTHGEAPVGCRCSGRREGGTQVASDPREPNIRQISAALPVDQYVLLHKIEDSRAQTKLGVVPVSSHRGLDPCCGEIEGRAQRPSTATQVSELLHPLKRITCQFQRVGLGIFPHIVQNIPVFHPRRYHGV